MIVKHKWLTDEDYVRMWALCTLAPGINQLAFATLIGRKLAGWPGIAATLGGILVPAGLITALLTAGFTAIQSWPPFQAVLRGVIPATAGLMFMVMVNMGRPLVKESFREGQLRLIMTFAFIVLVGAMIGLLKLPVIGVLLVASGLGALFFKAPLPPAKEVEAAVEPAVTEEQK
jgi:chromate transporter